jgi:hypothetical protein
MTTSDLLEDRIRHTLHAVAETVTEDPAPQSAPAAAPAPRRRHWRRWSLIGGAVAVPVLLAAGAYVQSGPEYVTTIPQERIIVRGDIDGDEYLLVRGRETDCPHVGVEVVVTKHNIIGSEWNTSGANYGQSRGGDGCYIRTAGYLANPALYEDGGQVVGDSYVWTWAVHPDVTAVRVTSTDGSSEELPVYSVDGAGYALYEIPSGVTDYTSELLIGDQVVPGSTEEQHVRLP